MDHNRKVLCICETGGEAALSDVLAGSGWNLHCWHQGEHVQEFKDGRVGIVLLTRADPDQLEKITRLLRRQKHLLLTAIIAPGLIDEAAVAEFVTLHCVDYQTLPIDRNRLLFALGHAAGMAELALQTKERSRSSFDSAELIGESPVIRTLREELRKIALSDAPVLVTGESGTGKELVAKAIHGHSTRCTRPFIGVNCVSLTPTLIHAELFGYEKGAFTGAHHRRIGHLEAANTGTIFIDEIGDLDLGLQALLLRFLEEKTVRRVGGLDDIPLDVRVIAATHVDIEAALKAGRFREDLYYRLNVLRIRMPALRDRPGDPTRLALGFLERFRDSRSDCQVKGFEPEALRAIESHSWPGNVRELMNRVRRAVVMTDGPLVSSEDLQLKPLASATLDTRRNLNQARLEAERMVLLASLEQADWRPSKAAELLGVSRATFYRLVSRHGLSVEETGQFQTVTSTRQ
jgi:DNA-binding NtrC family response regulator